MLVEELKVLHAMMDEHLVESKVLKNGPLQFEL